MENFVISEKVNRILETVKRNKDEFKIKGGKLPIDNKRIIKAIVRLCVLFNKSEKTRDLVIKFINNFLPFDSSKKVDEFENENLAHDAILQDVELAGIDEIMSVCNKFTSTLEYSESLKDEQFAIGDRESFEDREDSLRDWLTNQPFKIIHADFGYYGNPNYKKYLCRESMIALQKFVQMAIAMEEPVIAQIIAAKKQKIFAKATARKNKALASRIENGQDIYAKLGAIK